MFAQRTIAFFGSLVFGAVSCAIPALYALATALAVAALARTPEVARAAFFLVPWPLLLAMTLPKVATHATMNPCGATRRWRGWPWRAGHSGAGPGPRC